MRTLIRLIPMHRLAFGGIAGVCSFLILMSLVPRGPVSAATLVLKDGAVIHGEIQTLQDDVYTVETGLLGTVRVRKQDVRTIDHGGERATASSADSSARGAPPERAALEGMQSRMMQDPGLLTMIKALQDDPEVQAALADPEIVSALASGDYAALMGHPKIIALTRNAKVREIIEEVQ